MLPLALELLFGSYDLYLIFPFGMLYQALNAIIIMSLNHNQKLRSINWCCNIVFIIAMIPALILLILVCLVNDLNQYNVYKYSLLSLIQGATFISYIFKYKARSNVKL